MASGLRFAPETPPRGNGDNSDGGSSRPNAPRTSACRIGPGADLPAIAKGLIVLLSVLVLSWGAVAAMRRIPAVAKVI
ncbi:MAG: hypothetical protein ACLQAT_04695 [Candidatus Binataceae bacterium]